jgi:sugar lactone lactonase YvrE
MSYRYVLAIAALFLASSHAAADTIDGKKAILSLRHCTAKPCTVGEVQPVLALESNGNFANAYFEGVAVGKTGSIYTSEQCTGDVYRIRPNGRTTVIATIPYGVQNDPGCNLAGGLGLAISEDGDIWLAVISWIPESHGVWRIRRDGSAELAVPMSPDDAPVPNALAFDHDGNLYVTESFLGAVWKVSPGGAATLWLQSDLLVPPEGGVFGANGIAYKHGALYVANTDKGILVKVPLMQDGSAGDPVVIATGLNGPDGVTLDASGNLYAVTAYGAQLVRIRHQGGPEVVLEMAPAGVAFPTSVDFGKSVREMNTAYIANAIPLAGQPNLVKVNLCERDR